VVVRAYVVSAVANTLTGTRGNDFSLGVSNWLGGPLPSLTVPFPFSPLEVAPLNPGKGSGGALRAPSEIELGALSSIIL